MTETRLFAEAAARWSGQCALMFGWRPHEFWSATPAEVGAIVEAMQGPQAGAAMSRGDLSRLIAQDNGENDHG